MQSALNLTSAVVIAIVVMFWCGTSVFGLSCADPGDPVPPETTLIDGDLVLTETDTTGILLESPEPGGFDRIEVSGDATLSGLLRVRLLEEIDQNDVFEILTAQSILGDFDEVDARFWGGGQRWETDITISATSVTLRVIPPSFVLGDMNGDEYVDAFDVAPLELALAHPDAYAAMYPGLDQHARGDFTGDGRLNAFDIEPFEHPCGLIGGAHMPIPEPGMLSVFALGGLAMMKRRR